MTIFNKKKSTKLCLFTNGPQLKSETLKTKIITADIN